MRMDDEEKTGGRRRSRSRDARGKEERGTRAQKETGRGGGEMAGQKDEPGEIGSNSTISLSVEETNKLRLKLGLKPLNVGVVREETAEEAMQPGTLIPGDRDRTRHLAPEHWGERDRTKKIGERLSDRRDLRQVRGKLAAVKGLGEESSDEDDAQKWIKKQRRKVSQKEAAEKRAKEMDELDSEFGVGALVATAMKKEQQKQYGSSSLTGLKVTSGHRRLNAEQ
jgi:U4/U6.U5 tri-snRNP-associated protein 1